MISEQATHGVQVWRKAAVAVGLLLVLVGVVLLYVVLSELYSVWQLGLETPFVQAVAQQLQASDLLLFDKQPLHLTREGAVVLAFVLLLSFAWLAVSVPLQLVSYGVKLVVSMLSQPPSSASPSPASRVGKEQGGGTQEKTPFW